MKSDDLKYLVRIVRYCPESEIDLSKIEAIPIRIINEVYSIVNYLLRRLAS